ncbi:hypothetical protein C8Q79DRAFT_874096, partial [Trametes meyenii]
EPFIVAALLMTMVLHSLAATARLPVRYVLAVLQVVLHGAFSFSNHLWRRPAGLHPDQVTILSSIPRDLRLRSILL